MGESINMVTFYNKSGHSLYLTVEPVYNKVQHCLSYIVIMVESVDESVLTVIKILKKIDTKFIDFKCINSFPTHENEL